MSTKKKNVGRKPMRRCFCCEAEKPKGDMIRIVVAGRDRETEGGVKDDTGKRHGRGAYICKNKKCIADARSQGMIDADTYTQCLEDVDRAKLQMLSLAMKAGMLSAGEYQCEEAIKKGVAKYLIIAEDASDNTTKRFADRCKYRDIPYEIFGMKEELGRAIGKAERSVIALQDEQFSAQYITRFGGNE